MYVIKTLLGLSGNIFYLSAIVVFVLFCCFVSIYTLWFLFTSGNWILIIGGVFYLLNSISWSKE